MTHLSLNSSESGKESIFLESDLEQMLISKLQYFLLKLGWGIFI